VPLPRWPTPLPQRLPVGTTLQDDPEAVLVSEMDAGPDKRRERYTAVRGFFEIPPEPWVFSADQIDTLLHFFRTTTSRGTGEFMWLDPIPGLGDVKCQFATGSPKVVYLGGVGRNAKHRVEMGLQTLP
jgi:hypothetical protein